MNIEYVSTNWDFKLGNKKCYKVVYASGMFTLLIECELGVRYSALNECDEIKFGYSSGKD